jgi:hypothetical protein
MANDGPESTAAPQPIPRPQLLLDDIFLLLTAGMIVPTVFYLIWGTLVMLSVPPMP